MEEAWLPAPTITHVICTMGMLMLIFAMPFFYVTVANNIEADMTKKELKEIADYVSNTLANLYFLVNSTDYGNVSLEKELVYLPTVVENAVYVVEIVDDYGNPSKVNVYLKDRSTIAVDSWLLPSLKVGEENHIESGRNIVAGCSRNGTSIYAWIKYK